jgi:hypothetical protein
MDLAGAQFPDGKGQINGAGVLAGRIPRWDQIDLRARSFDLDGAAGERDHSHLKVIDDERPSEEDDLMSSLSPGFRSI